MLAAIVAALAAVAIGIGGHFLYQALTPQYDALPCGLKLLRKKTNPPTGLVNENILFAMSSIVLKGPANWSPYGALQGWTLEIMPTSDYKDEFNRKVGGTTGLQTHTMTVGSDMKALVHEMCHALEWLEDGQINNLHINWGVQGLLAAEQAYLAKMRAV